MKLTLKSISKKFPKWIDVNIYPPTILEVKRYIQNICLTSSDIKIYHDGNLLQENVNFRIYGITDGSILSFL